MDKKNRLKELRTSLKLTQKELAYEINKKTNSNKIYAQNISSWENGRNPGLKWTMIFCDFFNVSMEYFLYESEVNDLNEINYKSYLNEYKKDNIDRLIENLTPDMKSAFFNMFATHMNSFGISNYLYGDEKLPNINLDYIFILTEFEKVIAKYKSSLCDLYINLDDPTNPTLEKDLSVQKAVHLSDLISDTQNKLATLLNKLTKISIESYGNDNYELTFEDEMKELYKCKLSK
ncbi:helix-turn-helix transcriptional regulator [Clostridium paraputrificum]|uniref:helix-turn-helix transcriptional regulator n=1 Tax=Clostridium TaxID=1485 RepID=UPI003D33E30F